MLHLELGHNPNASARLRNKDFVRYQTKSAVAYQVLAPLVRRFQGTIIDSTSSPAFAGLQNQVIPAIAPHLGIANLNAGGIGLCGRDARKDGLCRLLPPLSCYLCPSFAALRDGPHREMLISIEAFLNGNQEASDKRILMQLADVRAAIRQVLDQLPGEE